MGLGGGSSTILVVESVSTAKKGSFLVPTYR